MTTGIDPIADYEYAQAQRIILAEDLRRESLRPRPRRPNPADAAQTIAWAHPEMDAWDVAHWMGRLYRYQIPLAELRRRFALPACRQRDAQLAAP